MNQIEVSAQRIVCNPRVSSMMAKHPGINWTGFFGQLIQGLLPMLLMCLGMATPKSYVESHYDESVDEYETTLLKRTKFQVRRKAWREHRLVLSEDDALDGAIALLDEARTMSDDESVALKLAA